CARSVLGAIMEDYGLDSW
nr:immunoglobulin heavy chain junction region [Macaca mulatta]